MYPDKILIENKDAKKINRYEVKLDTIGYELNYQADNVLPGKIFFWVCLLLPIIYTATQIFSQTPDYRSAIIITVLFYFLAGLNYMKPHKDDIFLVGGQKNLVFCRNKPNEKSVLEFINLIVSESKKYSKEKYTYFDKSTVEGELSSRLYWLKNKGIISIHELDQLMEEYRIMRIL